MRNMGIKTYNFNKVRATKPNSLNLFKIEKIDKKLI